MLENANVLIVDDDNKTAHSLKSFLSSKEDVGNVEWMPSVAEACEFLSLKPTDVVVLDLVMSERDGYSFLENMDKLNLKRRPDVIVTSAISHEKAIKKALHMGASYYMVKPCENEIVYRRIVDILGMGPDEVQRVSPSVDQEIMEMFLTLGLPPHLKGYQYLREAVKMVLDDSGIIYSITKRLYPSIAEKFEVTATKVELAIRHTLEVAWQRNKMENLNQVFGCEVYLKNIKPTNGEFIALVADKIATGRVM